MILSCIYLGHSGNTVLISNLKFETKSGRKQRETVYKGNLILDSLKGISGWESWIGLPNMTDFLFWFIIKPEEGITIYLNPLCMWLSYTSKSYQWANTVLPELGFLVIPPLELITCSLGYTSCTLSRGMLLDSPFGTFHFLSLWQSLWALLFDTHGECACPYFSSVYILV